MCRHLVAGIFIAMFVVSITKLIFSWASKTRSTLTSTTQDTYCMTGVFLKEKISWNSVHFVNLAKSLIMVVMLYST